MWPLILVRSYETQHLLLLGGMAYGRMEWRILLVYQGKIASSCGSLIPHLDA